MALPFSFEYNELQIVPQIVSIFDDKQWSWVINSDIPTGKGGGEKANYFIIIDHLLSSFIIIYHRLSSPKLRVRLPPPTTGVPITFFSNAMT